MKEKPRRGRAQRIETRSAVSQLAFDSEHRLAKLDDDHGSILLHANFDPREDPERGELVHARRGRTDLADDTAGASAHVG